HAALHPVERRDGDGIGAEAQVGGVTEADHAAVAEDEIEAHGGDGEDHDPPEEIEVEGVVEDGGEGRAQGQRDEADADGDRTRPRVHDQPRTAGNNPCGRKKSTAAMSRYISIEASAGPALLAADGPIIVLSIGLRKARPSVSTMPTTTAPTSAPRIEPVPPITMTTNTWMRISSPRPGRTV